MPAPYTQEDIDNALTALIAYAGNASAACKWLEAQGMRTPIPATVAAWSRTTHWERYEELREKFSQQAEHALTNNYRDAEKASVRAERA